MDTHGYQQYSEWPPPPPPPPRHRLCTAIAPFWFSTEHLWIIDSALLALIWRYKPWALTHTVYSWFHYSFWLKREDDSFQTIHEIKEHNGHLPGVTSHDSALHTRMLMVKSIWENVLITFPFPTLCGCTCWNGIIENKEEWKSMLS